MQENDIIDLEISGLAHDGRGLGRTAQGLVVFAENVLPGQLVRLRLDKLKKNMAEGRLLEILRPAPNEIAPPCPHAEACGGCAWQSLTYDDQLLWKRQLLLDSLNRVGKLGLDENLVPPVLPSAAGPWHYRNKMEFAFGLNAGGKPDLGLRRKGGHEIVSVTSCLLQSERCMRIVRLARDYLPRLEPGLVDALHYLVVREPLLGRDGPQAQCLVEVISAPMAADSALASSVAALGRYLDDQGLVTGFVHSLSGGQKAAYGQKTLFRLGRTDLLESIKLYGQEGPQEFNLGAGAFFQVNTRTAELLYNTALGLVDEHLPPQSRQQAWDLYCGIGGLSLGLAGLFAKVLGLDAEERAVALARQNAKNHPGCRFEAKSVSKIGEYFRRLPVPDLISLDPPRSGLAPELTQALLRNRPEYLLYVSCNPSTLSRDLALLHPAYDILNIQPVDMFPQGPHLETIVLLSRKS